MPWPGSAGISKPEKEKVKMKLFRKCFAVMLAVMLLCSGVAVAAVTAEGKVESTDPQEKMIKLSRSNPQSGAAENAVMYASDSTTYAGKAKDFASVGAGDTARIEVERDAETKKWMAKSVETS